MDYSRTIFLQCLQVNIGGLNVEGITVQQLEKLTEDYLLNFFNEAKQEQSKIFSALMKTQLNKSMAGYSTEQVIQWLREHTNGSTKTDFIQSFIANFSKVL
uniref:Uncharacterized protein n=1 Tax=Lygus hesperus TaxID=30085 RepID=A0A146LS34_LYGHE